MPRVDFEVVQPPTGGEVESAALSVLADSGVLRLVLLASEQQVPKPQEQTLDFHIRRTNHPEDGGMSIEGFTGDNQLVIVETQSNANLPARAHVITA